MKPIAISDDVTTCDCCGRTGLKRTVVLRDDAGTIRYHGTSCAAMAMYGYSDASVNNRVRKAAITEQSYQEQRQADAARKAANAQQALSLWEQGEGRENPVIEAQHRIYRQVYNIFDPGPNFIPWMDWLRARAAG